MIKITKDYKINFILKLTMENIYLGYYLIYKQKFNKIFD